MTQIQKEIPDLDAVKSAIKKFQQNGWPLYTDGENVDEFVKKITNIITSEINIYPNFLIQLKPKDFPFGIFRAREVTENSNLDLFTEHSYPPPMLTKLGRCNFPKHPVFYSSNNPITALAEAVRESDYKKKKFCISSWEIIDTDQIFIFENFLQTELHPDNQFKLLADKLLAKLDEPFENKLEQEKRLALTEFMKYVDHQFIQDKTYSFSATLAHRQLYANHNFCTDILMYPSAQTLMQGVNLAINPNFVDNHMRIKRFYMLELESYDRVSGKYSVNFTKYGEILKNVIFWRNINLDDEKYKRFFEEDFKGLITKEFKYNFTK